MNIVLVGFMGSGKSKVGKRLAKQTGRTLLDLDHLITGDHITIGEIFAVEGEAGFRKRERAAVRAATKHDDAIISTGGGTVLDPANVRELKRNGVVVYLKADADELVDRLTRSKKERPLLKATNVPKRVRELLAQRTPVYESVADLVVGSDERDPDHIVQKITRRLSLNGTSSRTNRVRVATDPPYTVHVGRGLLGRIASLAKVPSGAEKVAVITHPRLKRLWGPEVDEGLRDLDRTWITFPEGEEHKSLETAGRLTEAVARAGLHRDDLVVALGGGVAGDVAGFVASTFGRGVRVVQVPTTLLAMVDSSIGGKTGVNLPQGKNLVGTFHQPFAVIADLDVLSSLPEREFRSGFAEVIKYGFIADPALLKLAVKRRDEDLQRIVTRSVQIKAEVVASDERDTGRRAILNYGHTLGHAIELATGMHHGEAISVGMVYAAAVAALMGITSSEMVDEHRRVLDTVGLPTTVAGVTWNQARKRMAMDKKYAKGDRLVLLEGPAKPVVRDVPLEILERAWKEVAS